MSDPVQNQFDPVRFYTALDPYQHSVDNRPIQDLYNNLMKASSALDATINSEKIVGMAVGMIARGYSTDNTYVGNLSTPGGFLLTITHGFLVQSKTTSLVDLRQYPHLGLQQSAYTFPSFSAPVAPSNKICYMVQARKVDATSALSFYNPLNINSADVLTIGTVEYQVKASASISEASPDDYPLVDTGWVEILRIKVLTSDAFLNPENIQKVNFFGDGEFFTKDCTFTASSVILGSTTDTITGITVDANNALCFIDGVFQNPMYYTVVTPGEVLWNSTLPIGTTLDFVVMSGCSGTCTGAGPGGGETVYAYQVETFIVGAGGTTNIGPTTDIDTTYAFAFVNGIFAGDSIPVGNDIMNFPDILVEGTIVDLVSTLGGSAMPLGGLPGQTAVKTFTGREWQYPVAQAIVTSSANPLGVFTAVTTTDFDETTELYEGKLICISGAFTLPGGETNIGDSAVIQLGSVSLGLTRANGHRLLSADIFNGMIVKYTSLPSPHLELVTLNNHAGIFTGVASGTTDAIVLTMQDGGVAYTTMHINGALYLVTQVPATTPTNTVVFPTLQLAGYPTPLPITRGGANPLQIGDIVAGMPLLVMYNASSNSFDILNPASVGASTVPAGRRQTVLNGPYYTGSRNSVTKYDLTNTPAGTGDTASYSGSLIQYTGVGGAGVKVPVGGGDNWYVSFANGFALNGPVEYIERLPDSPTFYYSGMGVSGLAAPNLTSIVTNLTTETMVITTNVTHSFYPGDWLEIMNFHGNPEAALNGEYQVMTRNSNTQFTCRYFTRASRVINSFPPAMSIKAKMFVYADRNTTTGEVTYGVTRYRPAYMYKSKCAPDTLDTYMKLAGRHTFVIEDMKMYVGSGAAYAAVQRVFLGDVNVNNALSADTCTTYSYNGECRVTIPTSSLIKRSTSTGDGNMKAFNVYKHALGTSIYDLSYSVRLDGNGYFNVGSYNEADMMAMGSLYIPNSTMTPGVNTGNLIIPHHNSYSYLRIGIDKDTNFSTMWNDSSWASGKSFEQLEGAGIDNPIGSARLELNIVRQF